MACPAQTPQYPHTSPAPDYPKCQTLCPGSLQAACAIAALADLQCRAESNGFPLLAAEEALGQCEAMCQAPGSEDCGPCQLPLHLLRLRLSLLKAEPQMGSALVQVC